MKQLGGWATFCCWMGALGFAGASVYSIRHFTTEGSGNLTELALVVSVSVFFVFMAALPIQKSLGGIFGGILVSLMGGGALVGAASMMAHIVVAAIDPGDRLDPEAALWLLILGPLAGWLLLTGTLARRSQFWAAPLVPLAFASGIGLVLDVVSAVFVSNALSLLGTVLTACLPVLLIRLTHHHGANKAAGRIALFTVAPLVLIVGGLSLRARAVLAEREVSWKAEVAAERSRLASLRLEAPRGDAMECNSYDGYVAALRETAQIKGALQDLSKTALGDPFAPMPDNVKGALQGPSTLIQRFRDATRCRRADWGVTPSVDGLPSVAPLRILANLTLVEGHKDAQAGDLKSAQEHYADVLRFGAEIEAQGGSLFLGLTGLSIRESALKALGLLVVGSAPDKVVLAQTTGDLGRFPPPALGYAFAGERLLVLPMVRHGVFRGPSGGSMPVLNRTIGRVLATSALSLEGLLAETSEAVAEPDFAKASARIADLGSRVRAEWPIELMSGFVPDGRRPRDMVDRVKARSALVQAAVVVEGARGASPTYPAEVPGLPLDPFGSGAPIHYRVAEDGKGYQVWSAGSERKDHGGRGGWLEVIQTNDIVLERKQ